MTRTVYTDNMGRFTVDQVPATPYDVRVKHALSLAHRVNNVQFQAGVPSSVDFGLLLTGDGDNSNRIDLVDFSSLRAAFGLGGQTCGSTAPNSVPCADYDANGFVDVVDFSLLRSNYGQSGAS